MRVFAKSNLNFEIKFRLTDKGVRYYQDLFGQQSWKKEEPYPRDPRDEDGWVTMQIHAFANVFGSICTPGTEAAYFKDAKIEIQVGVEG